MAAACLVVLSLLFAGNLSLHELISSMVGWGMAIIFIAVIRRAGQRRFILVFSAAAFGKVAASLAVESLRVGATLWHVIWRRPTAPVGTLHRQPFRQGGAGPYDAGRRALVTAAKSFAPNEFVVDIPQNGDSLCVHSLARGLNSGDLEWPI